MRASIRAFLIVEFTHVITAFDATVLMVFSLSLLVVDGVWGVVAEADDEGLELDPDGVNLIDCLEKFTCVIPLLEDLLCDEKPKTGCNDTNRSTTNIAKPLSRIRCASPWCALFICAHLLGWLHSYLSLDCLNAVWPTHKFNLPIISNRTYIKSSAIDVWLIMNRIC